MATARGPVHESSLRQRMLTTGAPSLTLSEPSRSASWSDPSESIRASERISQCRGRLRDALAYGKYAVRHGLGPAEELALLVAVGDGDERPDAAAAADVHQKVEKADLARLDTSDAAARTVD